MIFKRAILIIHGFAGGTYDQEYLANYLELERNFDVFQFTLPGHDKNLSKSKHEDWIKKSEDQVLWLKEKGYNKIYIIGHSMGGVIATYLASKYKEVKKLILLAPAFHYLNIINNNFDIKETFKSAKDALKTYSSDEIISRFLKLDITSVKELMTLVSKYYEYPKKLETPTLIIQGKADKIVPISSSKYVYDNIKTNIKKIVYVNNMTHDIKDYYDALEIYKIIKEFLKNSEGGEFEI